jgi:hypothetical protein
MRAPQPLFDGDVLDMYMHDSRMRAIVRLDR